MQCVHIRFQQWRIILSSAVHKGLPTHCGKSGYRPISNQHRDAITISSHSKMKSRLMQHTGTSRLSLTECIMQGSRIHLRYVVSTLHWVPPEEEERLAVCGIAAGQTSIIQSALYTSLLFSRLPHPKVLLLGAPASCLSSATYSPISL